MLYRDSLYEILCLQYNEIEKIKAIKGTLLWGTETENRLY